MGSSSDESCSTPPSSPRNSPACSPIKVNGARPIERTVPPKTLNSLRYRTVGVDSGSTAVVALVVAQQRVIVANAGDSRCVVSRKGRAIDLSLDHNPDDPVERQRIENAGGCVIEGRVQGNL